MRAPEHEGAVEGDKPTDWPQMGNANAPALNADGLPGVEDVEKIEEDVTGADFDQATG
ncbi:MAG TPA: hypothetical protein VFZ98_11170 [Vicinamibacterales bacterium]